MKYNERYNNFKSKFVNQLPLDKRRLCKKALDKAVDYELPLRDNENTFQIRDIYNSKQLRISYNSPYLMCKYSEKEERILVGVRGPAWERGWKEISGDIKTSKLIGDFFHLANQYVYRSYQINILGAIALTYERPCDFRGDKLREIQLPFCNSEYTLFCRDIPKVKNGRNRLFSYYAGIINSFDPFVNKIIYYYIQALSLFNDRYDEAAVTAADNVIDTICQAIKRKYSLSSEGRSDMYDIVNDKLKFPVGLDTQLKNLYKLRCSFASHPAQSKWWDFSELYEKDIKAMMYAVKVSIIKFLQFEKSNRKIEKEPLNWSKWFMDNCDILYDAVWPQVSLDISFHY